MKSTKFWVVASVSAIIANALSGILWPNLPGMISPDPNQVPLFIVLAVIESISFGIGVSFILFGWKSFRSIMPENRNLSLLSFVSASWLLVSWWPHDNLHRTMAMGDYWQLIRIEWGFHFTLIIAGIIVASVLWKKFSIERL